MHINSLLLDAPIITQDPIVFGLLMVSLGLIFYTSSIKTGFWPVFYKYIPALFLAYLIPAILTTSGLIAYEWKVGEGETLVTNKSELYNMAKLYLLPAALVLMTISLDLKAVFNLGWKALAMFFAGTIGIVIGGPIALALVAEISPGTVAGTGAAEVWKGLSTLAGSWIGGGANQNAMLEIYGYDQKLYGGMVFVDIVVANVWMAIILIGIGKKTKINKWLKADTSAIEKLKEKVSSYAASTTRNPSLTDLMVMFAIAFGSVALAHFIGNSLGEHFSAFFALKEIIAFFGNSISMLKLNNYLSFLTSSFFWMISISTLVAIALSYTKIRKYEGAGASKIGSVFIYILVATIGMKMDLTIIFDNLGLLAIGGIWMLIHIIILIVTAKIIKAPYFFLAIGSQANVGGAASAPIVAAAFHPSLATVGVLLAVLGYAIGTVAAIGCTILMQIVSGIP